MSASQARLHKCQRPCVLHQQLHLLCQAGQLRILRLQGQRTAGQTRGCTNTCELFQIYVLCQNRQCMLALHLCRDACIHCRSLQAFMMHEWSGNFLPKGSHVQHSQPGNVSCVHTAQPRGANSALSWPVLNTHAHCHRGKFEVQVQTQGQFQGTGHRLLEGCVSSSPLPPQHVSLHCIQAAHILNHAAPVRLTGGLRGAGISTSIIISKGHRACTSHDEKIGLCMSSGNGP